MDDRMGSGSDLDHTSADSSYGRDPSHAEADEIIHVEVQAAWAEDLPCAVRNVPAKPVTAADRMKARFSGDLSWRAGDEAPAGDIPVSPYSVIDR